MTEKHTYYDNGYEINHVNYGGRYGGDDTVCQVKQHGSEIAHCTWHPGSSAPNRDVKCPYRYGQYCLDK